MNISTNDGAFRVTLSERNLKDLALQLERNGEAGLFRFTDLGLLQILVEPDARHYGDRVPGPGMYGEEVSSV